MKKVLGLLFILQCGIASAQVTGLKDKIGSIGVEIANLEESLLQKNVEKDELQLNLICAELKEMGVPSGIKGEEIWHSSMVLSYNEAHEQANWVFHQIHPDVVKGNVSRSNDFRPDEKVSTGSAVEADYFLKKKDLSDEWVYDGFGYDRGHLAPSADFRWNAKALSESYYYSNMSPQAPEFNREKWAELESVMRSYVVRNGNPLYVVTGPVLDDKLPKISRSENEISIPKYFFKVALDPVTGEGIGFLMKNEKCPKYVEEYAVSIDSVESLTGLNFFGSEEYAKEESSFSALKWLPGLVEGDVEPLAKSDLPKKALNTLDAKESMDSGKKVTVCGTVVSTKKSGNGNVFLNLDRSFPNHIFSITLWQSDLVNFSYQPHVYLSRQKVCVTGKIGNHQGVPSMNIEKEEQIELLK